MTRSSNFLSGRLETDAIALHCDERYQPCGWTAPLARVVDLKTFQNQTAKPKRLNEKLWHEMLRGKTPTSRACCSTSSFARRIWNWRSGDIVKGINRVNRKPGETAKKLAGWKDEFAIEPRIQPKPIRGCHHARHSHSIFEPRRLNQICSGAVNEKIFTGVKAVPDCTAKKLALSASL